MKKRVIPLMLIVLGCVVLFSSCSLSGNGDREKIISYLNAVEPDFDKSKDDLKVFDQEFGDSVEDISAVLELVKTSKADFEGRMEDAKKQQVPDSPKDMKVFHDTLILYYTDSIKLLGDFEQILNYSLALYNSVVPLEQAMNTSSVSSIYELGDMLYNLKSSIDECISIAENSNPPDYMADSNNNYIDVLKKFSSATDDFMYALELTDPLRINATTYRYELLSNKLTHIGDEMAKEIEEKQQKMAELSQRLEKGQEEIDEQFKIWRSQYNTAS